MTDPKIEQLLIAAPEAVAAKLAGILASAGIQPQAVVHTGEEAAAACAQQGMLMLKGKELHVNRLMLDKGEVDVDGRIDSLTYSEHSGYGNKGESIFSRLFR